MRFLVPVITALALVLAAPAFAASLSGRVTSETGDARANMEVRLWANPAGKAWVVVERTRTDASGDYAFDGLDAGSYLVDSRLPDGVDGTLADRWFDILTPVRDGWAGFAADVLELAADTNLGALDILLPTQGGLRGVITGGEVWVRIDNPIAPGFERNQRVDTTGLFRMHGLLVGTGFRLLAYDPDGEKETLIVSGPFTVNYGRVNDIGTFAMSPRPTDPYEPNDGTRSGQFYLVDSDIFHGDVRDVFISDGAYIGPRGGDVDTYCIEAQDHDRFLAYTITDLGLPGDVVENPWIDPMLRFITSGGVVLDESDDAPGFGLNAAVDSGDIQRRGTVCVQVTTFGDGTWNGVGQESAGDYTVVIELGNRAPYVDLVVGENLAPRPPGLAIVPEGTLLRVDIEAGDNDGDLLDAWLSHVDVDRNVITDGTFEYVPEDHHGTYTWTVPDDGARHAPYEVSVTVSDGEFESTVVMLIGPRAENLAPGVPTLLSPANHSSVESWTPTLELENATDGDGDALTYEFEIHYGDPSAAPDETAHVGGDPSGITSYITRPIEENQRVTWRARARDGAIVGGVSPWTDYWDFVVNVENELPTAPNLVKPDDGATVPHRSPTLSAENSRDGDGDTLTMIFEVATDAAFETIIRTSDPVEQNELSGRTGWAVDPPLDWGVTYFARVHAVDPRGGVSPLSNTREFRVKSNLGPDAPALGGAFGASCDAVTYTDTAPTEFAVPAVADPEDEALIIDFRIYEYPADYDVDAPVFQTTIEQEEGFEGEHSVEVPADIFADNTRYIVRIQATDGFEFSAWTDCEFLVRGEDLPPGPLFIESPVEGEVLPEGTVDVPVVVRNATDPNGDPLTVTWCAQVADAIEGCSDDLDDWNAVPQSAGERTEFQIEGVFSGAVILLRACAREATGPCGAEAQVTFSVDKSITEVTPSLCACDVVPGPRRDTAGWLVLWAAVLFAIRRRPAS